MNKTASEQPRKSDNQRLGVFLVLLLLLIIVFALLIKVNQIGPDKAAREITFETFAIDYIDSGKGIVLKEVNGIFVEGHKKTIAELKEKPDAIPDFYFKINSVEQFNSAMDFVEKGRGIKTRIPILYFEVDNVLNNIIRSFLFPITLLIFTIVLITFIVRVIGSFFLKK